MYVPEPNDQQFELPPAGTHLATCYRVIDLGTQVGFGGKPQHKVLVSWELPEELMKDGRPFTIGGKYTWSMSEKASLRHALEGWRGVPFRPEDFKGPKRFDIKNIVGKSCLLNIVHAHKNDRDYANVASVSRLMKGQKAPEKTINDSVYIWLNSERFDAETFSKLSDKLKAQIMQSPEYKVMVNGHDGSAADGDYSEVNPPPANPDDEIPF